MSELLGNLIRFGEVLRGAGLSVPAGAMTTVAAALTHVDIGSRDDVYFTLQALLVRRPGDLAVFAEAFRLFWRPPRGTPQLPVRGFGERRRIGPPEREAPPVAPSAGGGVSHAAPLARVLPLTYSDADVLKAKDFAAYTDDDVRNARTLIAALRWAPDLRRTRRWQKGGRGSPDWRRLLSASIRQGSEPVLPPSRRRRWRPRPLLVLADVSGSMERYARTLLQFVHAVTEHYARVESFLFATRLTRITRDMRRRGADAAVSQVLHETRDWGGGTRIGVALRSFNTEWARRVTGPAPVVLLISDGWDRGDPELLAREIGRLRRLSRRLIWLNPLLGSPDYQPLTRGMQAALPHVDDFLPVHNLASLEQLATHLNELRPSRGGRRRTGRPSSATPTPAGVDRRAP